MSSRRRLLAALPAVLLAGCGFKLRGPQPLPFATIHLGMGEYSELAGALRRQSETSGTTRVVNEPDKAEVRLQVLRDLQRKEITSLNAAGKVREYELQRVFGFSLVGRDGQPRIAPSEIVIKRSLTFSDAEVLAKEQEEALLYRDMQGDLVRQLLRRLAAAPRA